MPRILIFVFTMFLPFAALAADTVEDEVEAITDGAGAVAEIAPAMPDDADTPATLQFLNAVDVDVRDFIWEWRLLVVMADSPGNPDFERQLEAIADRADEFLKRDVLVIFDADPAAGSPLRQVMRPRGFMTAIIDKDGEVKARRPAPRTGRELMAVIDKFPLRRQEVLERNPAGR